jgi:predicted  nucleic acid-binding Zn-ribbon protein
MEWIIETVQANTDDEGKVDTEALRSAIKAEYPKYAVPKNQYNTQAEKLKAANDTLGKLQKDNKEVEKLQSQIKDYEEKVEKAEKELIATRNATTLKEALQVAGAADVEYMTYKLGELETDSEGNYVDLDNKIKSLQEENPKWFAKNDSEKDGQESDKSEPTNGYKPLDNKLESGKAPEPAEPANLKEALLAHYNK